MPRLLTPATRDGTDPVRRSGGKRTAWAPAALLVVLLAAARAHAQPQLYFSPDPKGEKGAERELALRPNVWTPVFLHVHNTGGPAAKLEVALFAGDERVPGASAVVPVDKDAERVPVLFGKATPAKDKDGKPLPLPLTRVDGPLSVRLFDAKGNRLDKTGGKISLVPPSDYVKVDAVSFDPRASADGKKNVLEVKLSARKNFTGPAARVALVLPPERIPDLVPGPRRQGTYGGQLERGGSLTLRAENLKFRAGVERRQGLFYVTIDGYPRAFSWVSSFTGDKSSATPRPVERRVMRLVHPAFVKPGAKLPVIVEVDNMPEKARGQLALYRDLNKDKVPAGLDGAPFTFSGDRAEVILFNPAGPGGALVFDSKVSDHQFEFDTKDIFGDRYLVASMIDPAKAKASDPLLPVLDSKKIPKVGLPAVGEPGYTRRIIEPVLMREGGPDLALDVNLPAPAPGKLPELRVGAPLPLKATALDPTGVVKAMFFQGKPLADGKLPPGAVEGEKLMEVPSLWVAQLPAPTDKGNVVTVGVQVTNGVGETTTKTIRVQLVDPKLVAAAGPAVPKLATITGVVREGDRPTPGVPVALRDDKGGLKAATKTDAAGAYKFEKVAPGAYVVSATRSASMTRGQTLISVPVGAELVDKNTDVKLTR